MCLLRGQRMVARRAARRVRENKFSLRFISVANPRVGNISAASYSPAFFLSLFDGEARLENSRERVCQPPGNEIPRRRP